MKHPVGSLLTFYASFFRQRLPVFPVVRASIVKRFQARLQITKYLNKSKCSMSKLVT